MSTADASELVRAMMCAALDRASLRDDESFFDAGGSSLRAAKLVALIASRLGVLTPVQAVYENPTATALSQHLAGAEPIVEPLRRQTRPDVVPLAPIQRRLWFHNRLNPLDPSYNMATAVRIEGALDVDALRAALLDVIDRHEILRTVHPSWDGVPQQVVLTAEEAAVDLELHRVGPDGAVKMVADEARVGFDVTIDVPIRALLVQESPDRHVLGLVIHHIACDGWSLSPLLADISLAYRFRTAGGPRPAGLAVQYADYALWSLAQSESGETAERELSYWRRELSHPPSVSTLDGMRPRTGTPNNKGGERRSHIGAQLHDTLVARARQMGASPFMVVHAALVVALQRMGASDDCVVGTPVAGRPDSALEPLVGFFVNTLALRVDVSGNPTFEGLVARVRATDLAALSNAQVPFDVVLRDLNPPREGGWLPLFGVMLAFQNTPPAVMDLPGLLCQTCVVPTPSARFDLRLEVVQHSEEAGPAGLDLTVTWAEQVGSAETATRLLEVVEQVLGEGLADPQRRVRRLGRSDGTPLDQPPLPTPNNFPRDRHGRPRLALICSPFGQQWAGMGLQMLKHEPVFAQAVDDCRYELSRHVSWDVFSELTRPAESSRLEDVTIGQPLVFVLQVGLARWLEHEGLVPSVVAGHSLGEIAACVVSGVLDLPDAARLVAHYTQQQGLLAGRGGGMLLVEGPTQSLERMLANGFDDVVIATVNGPRTTALAGPRVRLAELKAELESRNVVCAWIRVDVAAHGPEIDAVLPALKRGVQGIVPRRPRMPMISSVTGRELDWRDVGPNYFAANLRNRVRLAPAVGVILGEPTGALIEISANPILGPALAHCVDDLGQPTHVLSSMRRSDADDRVGPIRLRDFLLTVPATQSAGPSARQG